HLAFLELFDSLGELGHIVAAGAPAQIAALGAAARIDGVFLGGCLEGGLLALDGGNDVFGGLLVLDQDVAQLVFLAAFLGLLDFVVLGLDIRVGDRVLLEVVG